MTFLISMAWRAVAVCFVVVMNTTNIVAAELLWFGMFYRSMATSTICVGGGLATTRTQKKPARLD